MGFVVFAVLGVYLLIAAAVIRWAVRYAWRNSKSAIRWGSAATLAMYLPVFWDHIPTVIAHKYYCEKEAGFWVYKTVEQWKAENPGVMEGLVVGESAPVTRKGDMTNYTDTYVLNQRISWVVKRNGHFPFNRWRHEQEVVDTKNDEVLARYVDFSTSQDRPRAGWSGWKFWLQSENCSGDMHSKDQLRKFRNNLSGPEK